MSENSGSAPGVVPLQWGWGTRRAVREELVDYNVLLTKTRIFEVQFALGLVQTRSHPSVAVAKQRGFVVTGRAQ